VPIPKRFFGYSAAEQVSRVNLPSRGPLVRFGTWGPFVGMYVDPSTNEVFSSVERPLTAPRLVNSTLKHFGETVKAVLAMFPLYSREAELEERQAVAAKVADVIARIDAVASTPDTFWSTFIDDLVIGDFATEDILWSDRQR
jgi:hypothetical protein